MSDAPTPQEPPKAAPVPVPVPVPVPAADPSPAKKPKKAPHEEDLPDSVVIRPYPKAIFLYPTALCALVCGLLSAFTHVQPHTLGFVFMCVFFFNLVVLSFEFTRLVSVAAVLGVLVLVLLGIQLNERFHLVDVLTRIYSWLSFEAQAGFYFGMCAAFFLTLLGILLDTRFDYWELRGNEVLHHHGFLGDCERFPAPSLKLKKEITDVFEYMLLLSGRLVIFPSGSERAIVLENVPRINMIEEMITQKLHTLKVSFHTEGS